MDRGAGPSEIRGVLAGCGVVKALAGIVPAAGEVVGEGRGVVSSAAAAGASLAATGALAAAKGLWCMSRRVREGAGAASGFEGRGRGVSGWERAV